jgi:ribosomal protection tetracycline resistance protein
MFSGTLRVRDRVAFGRDLEAKVTSLFVFDHGQAEQRPFVSAGEIAKVLGLREIQVGDVIGETRADGPERQFPPPTFESVVDADDRGRLRLALEQLAEQDPLIDIRQDDTRQELSVSLYGEVQKEVIMATLADDYDIEVTFRDTTPIYVERPIGAGHAIEILKAEGNPFLATIGLRVEPAREGSGVRFQLAVDARVVPLYLYKTIESFGEHMAEYARGTLREGLSGWEVTDCTVTMTECTYSVPDGPPSRRGPLSTAADFRKLTPIVVMRALESAGTAVCEPMVRVTVEVPASSLGAVSAALHRLGADVETQSLQGDLATVEAVVSALRARDLQRELSRLTGGEGVLESSFVGYRPVTGDQPTRRRTTPNPLNRSEYLLHLARRATPAVSHAEP